MHDLDRNEDRLRGTYDFPFEFHHIESNHPRYVMSYHWHVEYEIIRILKGSLTVTLNEKSFIAMPGDIIFVHSGILHSGIPDNCVYQCIVFDGNFFLKNNSACAGYIQKILHQEIMIYHHFSPKHPDICDVVNSLFDALWKKPVGYEMTVIGQFYHFFGLVFGNHYYLRKCHTYTAGLQENPAAQTGSGFHRTQLCFSAYFAAAFCLCFDVAEVFLQILFGNDTSDTNGLSESPANRTCMLPALHYR